MSLQEAFSAGAAGRVKSKGAHLWDPKGCKCRPITPQGEVSGNDSWIDVHQKLLEARKNEKLTVALRSISTGNSELPDKIRTEADYFHRNALRMRYPKFRGLHLFVGSGVIEAGCKTVIGKRLKQSGMFLPVRGANAMSGLRCYDLNGRIEDYWEFRRAA